MALPAPTSAFDFTAPASYDPLSKRLFHAHAKRQLALLAGILGIAPSTYQLRSHQGDFGECGRVTLRSEDLHVEVSQPARGPDTGIIFRNCDGPLDARLSYAHFAALALLNTPEVLARRIRDTRNV